MSGYGYGDGRRQDQPQRVIPATDPPSRVTAPSNQEANLTRQAAKDFQYLTSSPPFATTILLTGNESILYGRADMVGTKGGGGTVSSDIRSWGWWSAISRYSMRQRIVGLTSGAGGTYQGFRFFKMGVLPPLLADPKFSPTAGRGVWRVADMVSFSKENAHGAVRAWWGLACDTNNDLTKNPTPFIGFRVSGPSGLTTGTWGASVVKDDGTTFLYNVDTHIPADALHELAIELDGAKHLIRFFIDGVLVGSYSPGNGTLSGALTAGSLTLLVVGMIETGDAADPCTANLYYLADGWFSAGWDFSSPSVAT